MDPQLVAALKRRTARNGCSAEAEHPEILREVMAQSLPRAFKEALMNMPDVGADEDFDMVNELSKEARAGRHVRALPNDLARSMLEAAGQAVDLDGPIESGVTL